MYDLCALPNDAQLLCQNYEVYALLCQEEAIPMEAWRSKMHCGEQKVLQGDHETLSLGRGQLSWPLPPENLQREEPGGVVGTFCMFSDKQRWTCLALALTPPSPQAAVLEPSH